MPPRGNITGFDPARYAASGGPKLGDPWKRAEAWRYTGPFTRFNRFKGSFPGLGLATVAFAGYLVYEQVFLEDHSHGHGEGHGSGH